MTQEPATYTLGEIATLTGATLVGDATCIIKNVADLIQATESDLSFYNNPSYEQALKETKAGALLVKTPPSALEKEIPLLIHEDPSAAFQIVLEHLRKDSIHTSHFTGIATSAHVDSSSQIEEGVTLCPNVVVEKEVTIGKGSFIGAGSYIGPSVTIGQDCIISPNVTIREGTQIGDRVILQPGVVLGSCGFGYTTDAKGVHHKEKQLGHVVIEDDVEIGANTTIDRGRFTETRIGQGTKIDNLVQIGHGVTIGRGNIIVSQTGIAGSSSTGNYVVIGGQVAIAGHISLCDNLMIAGRTAISQSITKPGKYGGYPPAPIRTFHRNSIHLSRIGDYVKELKELKAKLAKLEASAGKETKD